MLVSVLSSLPCVSMATLVLVQCWSKVRLVLILVTLVLTAVCLTAARCLTLCCRSLSCSSLTCVRLSRSCECLVLKWVSRLFAWIMSFLGVI